MYMTYSETVKAPENQPTEYDLLSEKEKAALQKWIDERIRPNIIKTYNRSFTSYGLKHYFEHEVGLYVSNGAFKGAMLEAQILPKNPKDLNWVFKLSRKFEQVEREAKAAAFDFRVFEE